MSGITVAGTRHGTGMNYIEIYQQDVINLPDVISYARTVLTAP